MTGGRQASDIKKKGSRDDKRKGRGLFTHAIFHASFDAILRTKPAPAYSARVFSRATLRSHTAKLAEIGKKGVFK